jgi:TolB protein
MIKIIKIVFVSIFLCLVLNFRAFAELSFEINNEEAPKSKILFFGFEPTNDMRKEDVNEIFIRIQRNLKSTNLFEIIKDESLPEVIAQTTEEKDISDNKNLVERQIQNMRVKNYSQSNLEDIVSISTTLTPLVSVDMTPDFKKYNNAGIGAILVTQFNYDIQGNLDVKVRLWDVLDQRQLFGKHFNASKENYKKVANLISNEIFKALTGEVKGHFNSKIAYVSESGNVKKRTKRIATIEFSGDNARFITEGNDLVLTPIFAKKEDELYFVSYRFGGPQIYKKNLTIGETESVGGFYASNFAAYPHPTDSGVMLLCAIFDGNADIYEFYSKENRAVRLTKNAAIDTTASYSPSGENIAFISDRGGNEEIYMIYRRTMEIEKISRGEGSYSKPIFSNDGTMLAFTVVRRGQFYIGTMNVDGSNERLHVSGYTVEGAKFSPNGRYLIYSKTRAAYGKNSIPRLFTYDLVTGYEYELPLPKNEGATDPDWINMN